MESFQDLGIVLRSVLFDEKHRMITAITENYGKISVVARNAVGSRRYGGAVDPFAASLLTLKERPGSDVFYLEEATVRRGFEGLRNHLDTLSTASVFNEIMLKIAPDRAAVPELFKLYANSLAVLEEVPDAWTACLIAFFLKTLHWCGNDPLFDQCFSCLTPTDAILSSEPAHAPILGLVSQASWACPTCTRSDGRARDAHYDLSLKLATVDIARASQRLSFRATVSEVTRLERSGEQGAFFRYLERLVRYHVPGFDQAPLKALSFLTI